MAEIERSEKDYATAFIEATGQHDVDVRPRAQAHFLFIHDESGRRFPAAVKGGGYLETLSQNSLPAQREVAAAIIASEIANLPEFGGPDWPAQLGNLTRRLFGHSATREVALPVIGLTAACGEYDGLEQPRPHAAPLLMAHRAITHTLSKE